MSTAHPSPGQMSIAPAARRATLATVRDLERAWGAATPAERREIVGALAARITLGADPVVEWRPAAELHRS